MSRKVQLNVTELDRTRATKVTDEYKDIKYLVVGKWGLIDDGFDIYSKENEVLAQVKQRSLGTTPRFDLFYYDNFVGSSVVHFSLYFVTIYINGLNWIVTGSAKKQFFTIHRGGHKIAEIKSYNESDKGVRIIDTTRTVNEPLVIAIAAILNHPSLVHLSKLRVKKLQPYRKIEPNN